MCGRFARYGAMDELIQQLAFDLGELDGDTSLDWTRNLPINYNILPTSMILTAGKSKPENSHKFAMMRWGFVPFFAKKIDPSWICHNARNDTVQTSGMFKHAFNKRRCLVIASGFYEWMKTGPKRSDPRIPHFFQVKDRPLFCFGAIWDKATIGEDTLISCAILTTEPNELMLPIHDRMPLILHRDDLKLWCDPSKTGDEVFHLVKPFPSESMTLHKVSNDELKSGDNPQCVIPLNSQ